MKIGRFIVLVCLGVVFLGSGVVYAQQITPVGITVSHTFGTYDPLHLIDDSGLVGGLHDDDWQNMWLAEEVTPWLVFDLGDVYELSAADIWQYLYGGSSDRDVQTFDIFISMDGATFTPVGSGSLNQATGATTPAQVVPFVATGQYVRFEVTANYGSLDYTGLSEVKFEGVLVPVELQSFSVE